MDIDFDKKSVLLRYVSEWDPRAPGKTKGGYLEGLVRGVPVDASRMVLQIVPDEEYAGKMQRALPHLEPHIIQSVHPLLLHVVRMGKGKRDNNLEPVPTDHHWKQEFIIDSQRQVRIVNQASDLDIRENRDIPVSVSDSRSIVTCLTEENCIVLGGKRGQLNLIALQPKQDGRAKCDEATLSRVLSNRLGTEDKNLIDSVENLFKKKNSSNLKMFRIRADFYNVHGYHLGSTISETIKDTGNKQSGAMDLHDVSVQRSCTRGGRKVFMESEYSLAKDVLPVFQVYDEYENHLPEDDKRLTQPSGREIKVRNNAIHIITPQQPEDVIDDLMNFNKTIFLLFKRESDGYCSPNKVKFQYDPHREFCWFCHCYPDTASEGQKPDLAKGLEQPKPRKVKRVLKQQERNHHVKVQKMSPSSSYCSSPEYVQPFSPDSGFSDSDTELIDVPISPEISNILDYITCFDTPTLESASPDQIPIFVNSQELCEDQDETLNTPQPILEPFNSFAASFSSSSPSSQPVSFRASPVRLTRREEIVTDCAVKQRTRVENIEPPHRQEYQEMRPTLRVAPSMRYEKESLETEEDEEDEDKGNTLLSYFPFLVLALILAVVAGNLVGVSGHHVMLVGLVSLLCVGTAGLYQSFRQTTS